MATVRTIGIDLGTTYSCVASFINNRHEIVKTDKNLSTMASFVSFTKNGRLIGDDAKENSPINPTNTIFDVKRFIGRDFNDTILQNDIKTFPFDVINEDNKPKIKVYYKQNDILFHPEEISAIILGKLKENAEKHFGNDISKAVITVPAHFNDSQRQATKDAGRIAGLEVLRIINEPTAAALAYGIHEKYKGNDVQCNILVYDFGGGTFDVSIISIDDGIFEVKATDGDTHLGGDDIDLCLVDHFANEFQNRYMKNLKLDKRSVRRLRMQCEKLKKNLSTAEMATIDIDNLFEDNDFYSRLTKQDFEEMCLPLFNKTLDFVKSALREAKMTIHDIHEIVLVGGSTRIPKVQEMVKTFFKGKELNMSLNPDEAIAIGAAVQAAIIDGSESEVVGGLLLLDVNPLTLGVEIIGDRMSSIIPRNSQIPTKLESDYQTVYNNQTKIRICVYEGERHNVKDNHLLGKFKLENLTPRKAGETKIVVCFELNHNGILHVTATEKEPGKNNSKSVDIDYDKTRLSDDEIERLIQVAVEMKRYDEKWAKNIEARLKFEKYCRNTLERLQDLSGCMTAEHREIIKIKCDNGLKWITQNMECLKEEYEAKEKEVYCVCNPIIREYL